MDLFTAPLKVGEGNAAKPRNGGLGAFIGEMLRMIERGEKQRVKDMDPQIVAKHYGTTPELIEAYRDFQLGGK